MTMQAQTNSPTSFDDIPYVGHSDAAEYNRLKALQGGLGYGETYGDEDTELHEALSEVMGYDIPDGRS